MTPWHALALVPCLLAGLGAVRLLMLRVGTPAGQGRFVVLDGLRGYLSFLVFLHHAAIWFVYLRTGKWATPSGHFYSQIGHVGVALFFMITGFLFFGKLLDGRVRGVDWTRLYVSRVLRLFPLYLFAVLLVFGVTLLIAGGRLLQDPFDLFKALVCWMSFTVLGSPDLNGLDSTIRVMAGVTWSLPYEWFLYLVLPLVALPLRIRVPWPALMLGAAAVYWLLFRCPEISLAGMFLGGVVSAVLVRRPGFGAFARGRLGTAAILACLLLTVVLWPSAASLGPLLLLTVAFALMAGGNDLLGLLSLPVSRLLGEISYSLYLLHGIALFLLFGVLLPPAWSASLSWGEHWSLVALLSPVLVLVCYGTFKLVEMPAMRSVDAITAWLLRLPFLQKLRRHRVP